MRNQSHLFKFWKYLDTISIQNLCLFLFALVYGLYLDPSPEHFSLPLLISAALLSFSFRYSAFASNISHVKSGYNPALILWVFFGVIGLGWPLLLGVIEGHSIRNISRDVVAFLMLLLPLFYIRFVNEYVSAAERNAVIKTLFFSLLATGLLFSLRRATVYISGLSGGTTFQDVNALSVSPEVLFSALFLISYALHLFLFSGHGLLRRLVILCLCFCGALLPLSVMGLAVMRGAFLVALLSVLIILFSALIHRPLRVILPLLVIGAALFFLSEEAGNLLYIMWMKTISVGLNARDLELEAVLGRVTETPWGVALGRGWGAVIANPATGGTTVNYTHSVFTALFLKTGLVSTTLYICLFGYVVAKVVKCLTLEKDSFLYAIYLALLFTLLINSFFYGGYKSVGYGLLLTLAIACVSCYPKSTADCESKW